MLMGILCISIATKTQAQAETKPAIFANIPGTISISEAALQNIFSFTINQETVIDFGNNFLFPCKVLRNENKYGNMQTVIIRSSAFDNAMLQVTKTINRDQSATYNGRIINERAADGFEIKRTATGQYQLSKFETDKVLEGCF